MNMNVFLKVLKYKTKLALELYGKSWKLIEEHIGTRTGTQVRSHAQKYSMKVNELINKGTKKRNLNNLKFNQVLLHYYHRKSQIILL